jgi:hypothetical protein
MEYGLTQLFELLNNDYAISAAARRIPPNNAYEQGLFAETGTVSGGAGDSQPVPAADIAIVTGRYSSRGLDLSSLPGAARRLFELSVNAFDAFIHAWMSELPIHAEMIRFGRRILAVADAAGRNVPADQREAAERHAVERAAADRGEADTRTVLEAAYKVWHEINRLMGFLRFSPGENGRYTARCAPDHFVLPALCEHFTQRFGDTPWIIIDEKRRFCLQREKMAYEPPQGTQSENDDWENLWRHYHKTINNESRNNLGLQKRFMPKRYWKYLPEL